MNQKEDILGEALLKFQNKGEQSELLIKGKDLEADEMDVSYYFRNYDQMPEIEQKALLLCKGKVLDIGAGAGSHALYLKDRGFEVCTMDNSPGAVEVMKLRGLPCVYLADSIELIDQKFDTLLLMMNGMGISGKLDALPEFLSSLLSILENNGQIIFDSTDLRYLFEEQDGSMWIDLNAAYYGEMEYQYSLNNKDSELFDWLYIDENTMNEVCNALGIVMKVVFRADPYHYLAVITRD
jgi:SAM-dependent methyltransferase